MIIKQFILTLFVLNLITLSSFSQLEVCSREYIKIGEDYFNQGKLDSASFCFSQVIYSCDIDSLKALAYEKKGIATYYQGEVDTAISYYKQAVLFNKKCSARIRVSRNYFYLSNIYGNDKKQYDLGYLYADSGNTYGDGNNARVKIFGFIVEGTSFINLNMHKKAIENFEAALELSYNTDSAFIEAIYSNLGVVYKKVKLFEKAMGLYRESLLRNPLINKTDSISYGISTYNMSDLFKSENELDSSLYYLEVASSFLQFSISRDNFFACQTSKVETLLLKGEKDKSKKLLELIDTTYLNDFQRIILFVLDSKINDNQIDVVKGKQYVSLAIENKYYGQAIELSELMYAKTRKINKELALFFIENNNLAKDSLLSLEETIEIQKQSVNKIILDKENENINLRYLAEISSQKKKNWIYVSICILGLLILLIMYFNKSMKESKQKLHLKDVEFQKKKAEKELLESNLDKIKSILIEKNKMIKTLEEDFDSGKVVDDLINKISTKSDWSRFTAEFELLYAGFFKKMDANKIANLSQNDYRLASLIKLNLSNKEIAEILFISPDSVKKAKQRLAKKFSLPENLKLGDFIISI